MRIIKVFFVLLIFCTKVENTRAQLDSSSHSRIFIGLDARLSYNSRINPSSNSSSSETQTYLLTEVGIQYNSNVLISAVLENEETYWNIKYAFQKYNWTTYNAGIKLVKIITMNNENLSFIVSLMPLYGYQKYSGQSNSLTMNQKLQHFSLNFGQGIDFQFNKKVSLIPSLSLQFKRIS